MKDLAAIKRLVIVEIQGHRMNMVLNGLGVESNELTAVNGSGLGSILFTKIM